MNIINQLAKTAADQSMETLEKFGSVADFIGAHVPASILGDNPLVNQLQQEARNRAGQLRGAASSIKQLQGMAQANADKADLMRNLAIGGTAGGALAGGGIAAALMGRAKKRKK